MDQGSNGRLLVFDCHEAWVYQLHAIGQAMDVIVGLPGRLTAGWDSPLNARCVRLEEVLASGEIYDCIVAHNLTDLLDVKTLPGPRLLVIHCTLGGTVIEQRTTTPPDELRRAVSQYVRLLGAHAMAVSQLKGRSWGLDCDVVPCAIDLGDYRPYRGDIARGLRVANQIRQKRRTLKWDFHEQAFAGVPVTIVGRNHDMPGIIPSQDWDNLKQILSRHRFFIHTADPDLEDGYNMAMLEAMAAGLPVLGNLHHSSPVRHGVNGFLADDPAELRAFAWQLLKDHKLAEQMGAAARRTVTEHFAPGKFQQGFLRSVQTARDKWAKTQVAAAPAGPPLDQSRNAFL